METRGILGSLRGNKRWRSNKEENDHGGKKKERKAAKMIVMGKKKGKGEVNGGTERKLKEAKPKGQPSISVGDLIRRPTELCGDRTGFVSSNLI